MHQLVSLKQIREAHSALPGTLRDTPLVRLDDLSAGLRCSVYAKCESLQPTGSYKVRAAYTVLSRLSQEQKRRGVALSSSGNFASAFAYIGGLLGDSTTLVMMEKTAPFKVEKTRRYGGEIVFCENRYEARFETLLRLRDERSMTVVNHLEDPNVVIGHGTIGVELIEQRPDLRAVLVPVSTGGLLAGIATAVKELSPRVRVIGVQPEGSNATFLSFRSGEIVRIPEARTICDALTATAPGSLPWAHIRRYVDDVVTVAESAVQEAVVYLAEHAKLVAEPGGAVAFAALRSGAVSVDGGSVVCLLSGGNIDPARLAEWLGTPAIPG